MFCRPVSVKWAYSTTVPDETEKKYRSCIFFFFNHHITEMGVRPVFEQVIKKSNKGS